MSEFTVLTTYVVIDCYSCHCLFAIPQDVNEELHNTGGSFYCPNGHRQHYVQSTERKLKEERDRTARLTARLDQERARSEQLERSRSAVRGQLTKVKKRVANGVCPCCNRTFADLAQHMQAKHPDYVKEP